MRVGIVGHPFCLNSMCAARESAAQELVEYVDQVSGSNRKEKSNEYICSSTLEEMNYECTGKEETMGKVELVGNAFYEQKGILQYSQPSEVLLNKLVDQVEKRNQGYGKYLMGNQSCKIAIEKGAIKERLGNKSEHDGNRQEWEKIFCFI